MYNLRKNLAIFCVVFLSATVVLQPTTIKAQPKTIVVPDDYPIIQEAVDNANDGDTIYVKSGIYEGAHNQTLTINKSVAIIGENPNNTILKLHPLYSERFIMHQSIGWGWSNPLLGYADNIVLTGLTIISDGGKISIDGNNTQIIGNIIESDLSLKGLI